MPPRASLEIYVLQRTRWQIHARLPESQKNAAISKAKVLEARSDVDGVKVIRELYDADDISSEHFTVYESPGLTEERRPGGRAAAPVSDWGEAEEELTPDWNKEEEEPEADQAGKRRTVREALTGVLPLSLLGVAIAVLLAGLAVIFLRGAPRIDMLSRDQERVAVGAGGVFSEPSLTGERVGRLEVGQPVRVTGRGVDGGTKWFRIDRGGGKIGYVIGPTLGANAAAASPAGSRKADPAALSRVFRSPRASRTPPTGKRR